MQKHRNPESKQDWGLVPVLGGSNAVRSAIQWLKSHLQKPTKNTRKTTRKPETKLGLHGNPILYIG